MNIGIHRIKSITHDGIHKSPSGGCVMNLRITNDEGEITIALFSDSVEKLNITERKE